MPPEANVTLTPIQETQIELIVLKAVDAYHKVSEELVREQIENHKKTCPIGEEFRITKAKLTGMMWGIGMASAGVSGTIATVISKLLA